MQDGGEYVVSELVSREMLHNGYGVNAFHLEDYECLQIRKVFILNF